jgi:hypothetical protein
MSSKLIFNIVVPPEALTALFSQLPDFKLKLDKIMVTQTETAAQITALFTLVDKIGVEIDSSLAEIQALKDLLVSAGNTDPAVTAAVDALAVRLTALDLKVPDAP